tara:strand:+ start:375 stop:1049 length:675 start_codon:yes stop_codon:yes gene_type:complete
MVATLFQLVYLLTILKAAPYASDEDDQSSFVSSLALFLTMFCGFAVMSNPTQNKSDADIVGYLLIFVTVFCLVIQFCLVIINSRNNLGCLGKITTLPLCRKCCKSCKGKKKGKKNTGQEETPTQAKSATVPIKVGKSTKVAPAIKIKKNKVTAKELGNIRKKYGPSSPEYRKAAASKKASISVAVGPVKPKKKVPKKMTSKELKRIRVRYGASSKEYKDAASRI